MFYLFIAFTSRKIYTYICMNIFFTASFFGKHTYQSNYDLVIDALEKQGATVISPEKGNYYSVLTPNELSKTTDKNILHYQAIRKGIDQADAVVFEISHEDFQVGFEAAYALESKKYVLALSTTEDFSKKIKHPFFKGVLYSEYTIDNEIESFIRHAEQHQFSERFNFFLSSNQQEFLRRASEKEGLNQSEYLRLLIDEKRLD